MAAEWLASTDDKNPIYEQWINNAGVGVVQKFTSSRYTITDKTADAIARACLWTPTNKLGTRGVSSGLMYHFLKRIKLNFDNKDPVPGLIYPPFPSQWLYIKWEFEFKIFTDMYPRTGTVRPMVLATLSTVGSQSFKNADFAQITICSDAARIGSYSIAQPYSNDVKVTGRWEGKPTDNILYFNVGASVDLSFDLNRVPCTLKPYAVLGVADEGATPEKVNTCMVKVHYEWTHIPSAYV